MHSRSPLKARGGSSCDSGKKKVEARARARIPGAGGTPAPRPRPATHGAESPKPLSLSLRVALRVMKSERKTAGSRTGSADTCRGPRGGQAPGSPRKTARTRASTRHRRAAGSGDSTPRIARETRPGGPRGAPEADGARDCARPPRKRNRRVLCWNRLEA